MKETCGIFVDLDLCTGCYACEVACKQENNVSEGSKRVRVETIGPSGAGGMLRMEFVPVFTDSCTLCGHRITKGLEPKCVENCPTEALLFFSETSNVIDSLRSEKCLQICKFGKLNK